MDFIGIDVGTSGCKAAVFSETGNIKKSARREYRMMKHADGRAVLSLSIVWNSVKEILKEISAESFEVRAAAVSSLGETMVFLDGQDNLLLDEGITYMDSRNQETWKQLKGKVPDDELYEITGKTQPHIAAVNQYSYWLSENPALFDKTKRILFVDSYIAYMLCGEAQFDYSTASNTLFYDINTYNWSERLVHKFGINLDLFPRVTRAGSYLGRIRKEVSEELALPHNIEILTGCHDQISAMLGGGAVLPGEAVLGEGTTEALNLLFNRSQMKCMKAAGFQIEPFVQKKTYFSLQSRLMHGSCIKWFANSFGTVRLVRRR